jgi:hypothetical protein
MRQSTRTLFTMVGSLVVPVSVAFAQNVPTAIDCNSPETPVQQKHCSAKRFFEDRFMPLPLCGKHPNTYGEKGWRNTKGELILIINKHHQQKQAYCKALMASQGASGSVTVTPATQPDRSALNVDSEDVGPEPKCEGLSGMEFRVCKIQRRTWRTHDRQVKWQMRQEQRQTELERMVNDIIKLLRSKSSSEQLRARTQQAERVPAQPARLQSIRGIRENTYRGYTTPARTCISLPLRERAACMKRLTN